MAENFAIKFEGGPLEVVEEEILSEDLLAKDPMCEMVWGWEPPWQPCPRPSVARVKLRCPIHGVEGPTFICDVCLKAVLTRNCVCCFCINLGLDTTLLLEGYY